MRRHDAGVHEVDGAPVGHPHDCPASLIFRDSLRVRVSITITPTAGMAQIHTNTLGASRRQATVIGSIHVHGGTTP